MNTNENSTLVGLPSVEIYTDGGCEPNPGPGGYGVVVLYPKKRAEVGGGFCLTTHNRMEIFAAIAGLEMLKQRCQVTFYSDSQYLVDEIWHRSSRRKEAHSKKSEFRNPKPEIVCSLVTSAATNSEGVRPAMQEGEPCRRTRGREFSKQNLRTLSR